MKSQHSSFLLLNCITELRFPGEITKPFVGHFYDSWLPSKSIKKLHCYKQQKLAILDIAIFYAFDVINVKRFYLSNLRSSFSLQTLVIQRFPKSMSTCSISFKLCCFFQSQIRRMKNFLKFSILTLRRVEHVINCLVFLKNIYTCSHLISNSNR